MSEQRFTCNTCGTSGSLEWMRDHPCQEVQDVTAFGGRCEDYPCCGHGSNGCMPLESHTKAFWQKFYEENPEALYDPDYLPEGAYE